MYCAVLLSVLLTRIGWGRLKYFRFTRNTKLNEIFTFAKLQPFFYDLAQLF